LGFSEDFHGCSQHYSNEFGDVGLRIEDAAAKAATGFAIAPATEAASRVVYLVRLVDFVDHGAQLNCFDAGQASPVFAATEGFTLIGIKELDGFPVRKWIEQVGFS
jgi:hypothetical protein